MLFETLLMVEKKLLVFSKGLGRLKEHFTQILMIYGPHAKGRLGVAPLELQYLFKSVWDMGVSVDLNYIRGLPFVWF